MIEIVTDEQFEREERLEKLTYITAIPDYEAFRLLDITPADQLAQAILNNRSRDPSSHSGQLWLRERRQEVQVIEDTAPDWITEAAWDRFEKAEAKLNAAFAIMNRKSIRHERSLGTATVTSKCKNCDARREFIVGERAYEVTGKEITVIEAHCSVCSAEPMPVDELPMRAIFENLKTLGQLENT